MIKKSYEDALDAYTKANTEFENLKKYIETGEVVRDIIDKTHNKGMAVDHFVFFMGKLKEALDERNSRLREVQDALRQEIQLATKPIGPDTRPTILNVDEFCATSVTRRRFDEKRLLEACEKCGVVDELKKATSIDKDGKSYNIVEVTIKAHYEPVLQWLKVRQLDDVIRDSYKEEESTPAVRGPREVAWLGEKKK